MAAVERQSEEEIATLHRKLRAATYKPEPVKGVWIPKREAVKSDRWGSPPCETG